MSKYWFWGGIGSIVLILAISGILAARPYVLRGSVIDPPIPAADFTLTTMNHEQLSLSDLRGNIVLLFFGFTSCPDVCPTTMAEMKEIYSRLGDKADNVKFLFITVDPDKDTPEQLEYYVGVFNPNFIGLTGSIETLEKVWKDYFVYREIRQEGSSGAYTVDHTARVYLVDGQGYLRLTYAFGTPVDDFVEDLRHLLKAK